MENSHEMVDYLETCNTLFNVYKTSGFKPSNTITNAILNNMFKDIFFSKDILIDRMKAFEIGRAHV